MSEEKTETKVTGVRLSEAERETLRKLGNGSITLALRDAIDLLFRQHQVKPASQ